MNLGAGANPERKMGKKARNILMALAALFVLLPVKVCWTKYSYTVSPLGIQIRVNGEMKVVAQPRESDSNGYDAEVVAFVLTPKRGGHARRVHPHHRSIPRITISNR